MASKKLNLLADFPAVTRQQWMDKVTADLKGADFDKKLVWKTNEGFNVMPFYRSEDIATLETTKSAPGQFPFVRGTKTDNKWLVRQDICGCDAKEANSSVKVLLTKGVNSVCFDICKEELELNYVETLLDGVDAENVELNFKICVKIAPVLAGQLCNYFATKSYDVFKLQGSINCDPINRMLTKGQKLDVAGVTERLKNVVDAVQPLPLYRVAVVNAITLNNAGATAVQELGYALAWGNDYLNMLIEAGVNPARAAKRIKFNFGVGSNYFMEIAKFRAARLLWAKIVDAYKVVCPSNGGCPNVAEDGTCVCAKKMKVHAETSFFNMTIFDANVNMLRTQTEAMSAAIGGVDSLTVLPYDAAYKESDEFSQRIARNQQLLLKEECHFDKVADAAGGSYYIETLTSELAAKAWEIFLSVENSGGFLAQVLEGSVQKAISETAAKRFKAVSTRRENLLGTNQFPNFAETASQKIEEGDCGCGCSCNVKQTEVATLSIRRAAEDFEDLRLSVEKTGRKKVFMLTIGSLSMRLARAQFSCNFFACAGYEVIDNLGFNTVEEGVSAAQKAGADIIVICSSDDEYKELAPAAYKAIDGKQIFVVAGAPSCQAELEAVGIKNFISVKSNVLETLKTFNA